MPIHPGKSARLKYTSGVFAAAIAFILGGCADPEMHTSSVESVPAFT